MKKRLLATLLALVLALALLPLAALATTDPGVLSEKKEEEEKKGERYVASVTTISTGAEATKWYKSLADAVTWSTGTVSNTITLLDHITLKETLDFDKPGTYILDLNGKTLTGPGPAQSGNKSVVDKTLVVNKEGAVVTIRDSAGGGTIRCAGGANKGTFVVHCNKGKLTIEGGAIVSDVGTAIQNDAELTITGGTITGKTNAVVNWGGCVIGGGDLTGNVITMQNKTSGADKYGTTEITNGSIKGDVLVTVSGSTATTIKNETVLAISGKDTKITGDVKYTTVATGASATVAGSFMGGISISDGATVKGNVYNGSQSGITIEKNAVILGGVTAKLPDGSTGSKKSSVTVTDSTVTGTIDSSVTAENITLKEGGGTPAADYQSKTVYDKDKGEMYYQGKLTFSGLMANATYLVTYDNGAAIAEKKTINGVTMNVIPRIGIYQKSDSEGKITVSCQLDMIVAVWLIDGLGTPSEKVEGWKVTDNGAVKQ